MPLGGSQLDEFRAGSRPGALRHDRLIYDRVRKGGILQVHAIHEDVPFDPATKSAVHSEVEKLALWLCPEIAGL